MQTTYPASAELRLAVHRAIAEAELSAEYGVSSDLLAEVSQTAHALHEWAQDLTNILPAMTAAVACWVAKGAQFIDLVSTGAAYGASVAAQRYGCAEQEIQSDFERLRTLSRERRWDDHSPVSVDVLPPLPPERCRARGEKP